jgi:23S rRNA pseudouridine1911/1915/1917 synthase
VRTEIVYEDDSVIVCYKPAGLATQTAKTAQADMVSELKNYLYKGAAPYLGVVHRLDQPVEGLLVFAKNKKTAAVLSEQLATENFNKHYYAVICGQPERNEGRLVDYLAKTTDNTAVVRDTCAEADGEYVKIKNLQFKEAVLSYKSCGSRTVNETDGENIGRQIISLLDIQIETGRFHQIRAQLSHAGTPLLGDGKYGNEKSVELSRRLRVKNVALCAYRLEFVHPVTGKLLKFERKPKAQIFGSF